MQSRQVQDDEGLSRKEKAVLFGGVGTALLTLIVFLLYFFVIRDTWEDDHRSQVGSIVDEASALQTAGKSKEAANKYRELLALVGSRNVSDPTIVEALNNSKEEIANFEASERAREARISDDRKREAALAAQRQIAERESQLAQEQQLHRERERQAESQRRAALRATISGHAWFNQGAQSTVLRGLEVSIIRAEIPASQISEIVAATRQAATQLSNICLREAEKWDAEGKNYEQAAIKALTDSQSRLTLDAAEQVYEKNSRNPRELINVMTIGEIQAVTVNGFAKVRYAKAEIYRAAGKMAMAGASDFSDMWSTIQPGDIVDVRKVDSGLYRFNVGMSAARNTLEAGSAQQPTVRFGDDYVVWPDVVKRLTVAKAITDVDGKYVVSGVPVGKYLLQACRSGFDTEWLVPIDVTDGTNYTTDLGNQNANKWAMN